MKIPRGWDSRFPVDSTATVCHLEAEAFPHDIASPEERPQIETRLLRCLHIWSLDHNAINADGRTVVEEISGLLERYIGECIPYGPKKLGGWWSDGLIHLEINGLTTDRFKLLGVTWIDCRGIAPFEIDLELDPKNEAHFRRTVFRIGILDDRGCPLICDRDLLPSYVLENRPKCNRDWAMAVELTFSAHNVTEQRERSAQE